MQSSTIAPDQLFGYDVCTQDGDKIGSVDNVWVDDATDQTEFIGVKTGWLFGKTHVVPTAEASIGEDSITLPYSKDQIEGAPSFDADAEISPDEEEQIYSYYGLDRSIAPSPTGLASGEAGTTETRGTTSTADRYEGTAGYGDRATGMTGPTDTTGTDMTGDTGERDLTLSEEQLNVGKRAVEAGQVRLRKVVRTEHQEVPVELKREEVEIERIPAEQVSGDAGDAFQDETIDVPLMQEEPVVEKTAQVTGGVRVTKDVETETQTVGGDVRSEDVEVDRDTDPRGLSTGQTRTVPDGGTSSDDTV
jgi:uncharacterized protein (TIGR02271 family)